MILTEEVEVTWQIRNKTWYINKGYAFTHFGDKLIVNIEDITKGSDIFVKIKCDFCGKEFKKTYYKYNKQREIIENDCCNDYVCRQQKSQKSTLETYGVTSCTQLSEVKEKIVLTFKINKGYLNSPIGYKYCTKCKQEKPLESFKEDKNRELGVFSWCKDCCKKDNRKLYEKDKVFIKERTRIYQEANPEKVKVWGKTSREKNKHKMNIYFQKYRNIKKQLLSDFNISQWEKCKQYFDYKCAYCGLSEEEHLKKYCQVLHQDHFISMKNKGTYTVDNIIPACAYCNTSKSAKDFYNWYPKNKNFSTERLLKVENYITIQKENLIIKETLKKEVDIIVTDT